MERDIRFGGKLDEVFDGGLTELGGPPERDFVFAKQFERQKAGDANSGLRLVYCCRLTDKGTIMVSIIPLPYHDGGHGGEMRGVLWYSRLRSYGSTRHGRNERADRRD